MVIIIILHSERNGIELILLGFVIFIIVAFIC